MIGILLAMALLVVYTPFALLLGYFDHFRRLEQRDAEVSKAAHGVALAILMPVAMQWADQHSWLSILTHYTWPYFKYRWFAVYAIMAFGGYWFLMGAARSRGYRDMRYITRSLLKIGVGGFLLYANINRLFMDYPWRFETFQFVALVGYWCIITGLVKFCLYMRGPPRPDLGNDIGPKPYGGAGYGTGFDE
jgi:hypothetical protein